ncbi:4163_t:CDS:2 [Funneliformis geosporum]|uniref:4163_t:CDS:1 n=1 Tax=Funneliformis geosporum TaxID=1117311 RepID=A0A9W4WVQ0_9GLOM|nr:4163_t:CDS:2 [Funneliformis geosporum]
MMIIRTLFRAELATDYVPRQKWLQEQQAENSRQITELSQMLNEYERKQTQYQQTLQEELNKLQNSPKNTKIKGLEAKIKESQEETERIRQQIQELEANYQEKLTQLDQEFAESSELTNEISFSDNQLGQCASCDKKLQEGEQYFYYPQDPEKRAICTTCKPQVDNAI